MLADAKMFAKSTRPQCENFRNQTLNRKQRHILETILVNGVSYDSGRLALVVAKQLTLTARILHK